MPPMDLKDYTKNRDRISLKELVLEIQKWRRYLFLKWKVLLVAILLGAALGASYALLKKPLYTAISTFVLDGSRPDGQLGQYAGLASMMGVSLPSSGSGIFQSDNIIELYLSRKMVQKTLLTPLNLQKGAPLLIDRYLDYNHLRDKWQDKSQLRKIKFNLALGQQFSRLQDSVLREVFVDIKKNYLSVTKFNDNVNMIKVEVKAGDEIFAKKFNDYIVKNVNDFYIQTKTKIAAQNVQILQHQTDSVKSILNGAIISAAAVTDATANLNPTRLILRVPVQRSQVNAEANKAILSELVKNLELAKISFRKETPLIEIVDIPILPLEKTKTSIIISILIGSILTFLIVAIVLVAQKQLKLLLSENYTPNA
jgi:hypothetical protein